MEDWLITYEAADVFGYNLDYIRQLIRASKVQGRKLGQAWQVNRRSLETYIKNTEQLGEHENATAFIRAFAGDNRYIVDYLVEEVLQRQPESVRNFVLQTSILDRLNGSLCDLVTA